MATISCSAVLLAAGRSTRMGRDKATLELDDAPLWRRQRDLLAGLEPVEMFLSARPEQPWTRDATGFSAQLRDAMPNAGPLCGITAALERMTTSHLIVLAIDLPRMNAAWFRALLALCEPGRGAIGRNANAFEPLAAIYPREWMPVAWEALATARYALQPLINPAGAPPRFTVREIGEEEARLFENWNEPTGLLD